MDKYGNSFAQEVNISIEKNTPAPLFQLLVSSMLFSARIGSDIAEDAARNLFKKGWTTPTKMLNTTWSQRVKVLNEAHYTRYQEKTATFLEDIAQRLQDKYKGDLNNLREKAGKKPKKIRELLKEFKGVGDVGVDIFFREIQTTWEELYPYVDDKAEKGAEKLGLPKSAKKLAEKVKKKDFPRLLSAIVRADLNRDYDLQKRKGKEFANDSLSQKTKKELYEKAKEKHIEGRSKMKKEELVEALQE